MPFLTARWENLVLLNWECPARLLEPHVPAGTELDPWRGSHIVSLVGFRFVDTRLLGIPIPFHRTFEEVNLRFYVRRSMPDGRVRRAVVFLQELVPRFAISLVARLCYNEPYSTVPMSHVVDMDPGRGGNIEYSWTHRGRRHRLAAVVEGPPRPVEPGSEAEFITEHYWGYTARRDGGTLEYRVEHPSWRVWSRASARYESPEDSGLYPAPFEAILQGRPRSAFVAEGSRVGVYAGRPVDHAGPDPRGSA